MPDVSNIAFQSIQDLVDNAGLNENQTESGDIRLALNDEKVFGTKNTSNRNSTPTVFDFTSKSFVNNFALDTVKVNDPGANPDAVLVSKVGNLQTTTNSAASLIDSRFQAITIETEFKIAVDSSGKAMPLIIKFDSTPETMSFAKSATWTPIFVLGRPEPVQVFSSSSAITSSMEAWFFVNSKDQHLQKLKISDYLMALVTPTKKYFLPSPVKIAIGNWKLLRAIITQATITYEGPWSLPPKDFVAPGEFGPVPEWTGVIHAPYLFKALIQFTLVTNGNKVKYAEDIINSGFDIGNWGGIPSEITPGDTNNIDPTKTDDAPAPNNPIPNGSVSNESELPVLYPGSLENLAVDPTLSEHGYSSFISGPATTEDLKTRNTQQVPTK